MKLFQKLIAIPTAEEQGIISLRGEDVCYLLTRTARRRRTIAYTINDDAGLRIMAPLKTRWPVIQSMLQRRAVWILTRVSEQKKMRGNAALHFIDGEDVHYLGRRHRLRVMRDMSRPQGCVLRPHYMDVNIVDPGLSTAALREEVRLEILLWLKKRARAKFKKRLDLWAPRLGVNYTKLLVTDPARQWGSCTVDNVIRLNWRLMMAPLELLDYVVAHELAHVRHKNHSPRFWSFLDRAMPDYKARRQRLRHSGAGFVL